LEAFTPNFCPLKAVYFGDNQMTEDEYYAGEFTDGELNCQADLADYRKAVEEFYWSIKIRWTRKPERSSGGT